MLFIFNYVAPDEPITSSKREIHCMGGLHLHDILHPYNLLRQYVKSHSRLVFCRNLLFHNRKVNDFFLKCGFTIYNSCKSQK